MVSLAVGQLWDFPQRGKHGEFVIKNCNFWRSLAFVLHGSVRKSSRVAARWLPTIAVIDFKILLTVLFSNIFCACR